jgi:dihydroorotase
VSHSHHPHGHSHPHPHPHPHPRREFLRRAALGSLVLTLGEGCGSLEDTRSPGARYDLLISGGRVVDPSQGLSAPHDVAVSGHTIARVAPAIPRADARRVLDAAGKIVTPGLIDVHVHVYDGVAPLGIPADPNCIAKGVTTVLDAGSAGAHTFPAFRRQIPLSDTRIFALLNISVIGQASMTPETPHGELLELRYADPKVAIRTIEEHRDVILGIKIRLSREIAGENDLKALAIAREAADAVKLPLMVHIGDTHSPLKDILAMLGKGDVVTHTFHGRTGGILDGDGRVVPEIRAAVGRGVHLDVGHGRGSFSFDVAEKALRQDLLPGTISSDVHRFNVDGPVFDLATTLSKFMHLGLTLDQVIERAATRAANAFGFPKGLGTLREGAEADVSVWSLAEGDFEFADSLGAKRRGHRKLVPVATVKAGRVWG